jgi:GT2 family glycosyltransferase
MPLDSDARRSPRVAVIVINWKRPAQTIACLRSLSRLDYPIWEPIVVDNGAPEGNLAAIRTAFPQLSVIEAGYNRGFAGANNLGIAEALRRGADYVLLLNDDTEVAPDLLSTLVNSAEPNPQVGIVGPTICYFDEPNRIWFGGGRIGKAGEAAHLRADEIDDGDPQANHEVDYVTGCAMLVKRAVIDRIGGLDERFFAYFEETEWCTRARQAGFQILYVPRPLVWHKIQPDQRSQSPVYLYLMTRNRLLYLRCAGAGALTTTRALLDLLRTAASWRLRPRHRRMRPLAGALLLGVRDFLLGRFGSPPHQVASQS